MANPKIKELTQTERIFARGLSEGLTQGEAYRIAMNRDEITHGMKVNACKMAARPQVQEYKRKLLEGQRITDLDSVGEAWRDLKDMLSEARAKENFNAAAQLQRQRLQGLGALDTRLTIRSEIDDKTLIKRITGDDATKAAALQEMLGDDTFDDETKH